MDVSNIVQVLRMVAITPTPNAPDIVEGVINIRGKVIPVINMRKQFGLKPIPYGIDNHLLIARHNGQMVGLILDRVSKVLTLPASQLERPTDVGLHIAEYLSSVAMLDDRLILIINLETILNHKAIDRVAALV